MTAVLVKEPPVNQVSKGPIAFKLALINPERQVWLLTINQAPTSGTSQRRSTTRTFQPSPCLPAIPGRRDPGATRSRNRVESMPGL